MRAGPARPLRALDILAAIPAGCVTQVERDDKNLPHIQQGETIVADTSDRDPMQGEVFLIEWTGGRRDAMKAVHRRYSGIHLEDGTIGPADLWSLEGLGFCLAEGPMDEAVLRSKIVGRVIGIYDPAFEHKPMKMVGGSGR